MKRPFRSWKKGGFTLVELIVSMGILVLLMLVLISITDATRRTWTYTTGKVEQFHDAREAFESITRKLSQATLNNYWAYDNPNAPTRYERQSELRYLSGPAASGTSPLLSNASLNDENGSPLATTSHAVFFQAPLGYVSNPTYSNLETLLNTWGYFVEFGSDKHWWPGFVSSMAAGKQPAQRYRFRVMELMEPSDSMTLYSYTSGTTTSGSSNALTYTGTQWFTAPLGLTPRPARVLAENIIALVILPKLSQADEISGSYNDASLAPNYRYDSTGVSMPTTNLQDANLDPVNQLPPVVQVTMIAVDETSASRLQSLTGTAMPDLGLSTLFQTASNYQADLDQLQANLLRHSFTDSGTSYNPATSTTPVLPMSYRVFTSAVSMKSAKWSRQQTDQNPL